MALARKMQILIYIDGLVQITSYDTISNEEKKSEKTKQLTKKRRRRKQKRNNF